MPTYVRTISDGPVEYMSNAIMEVVKNRYSDLEISKGLRDDFEVQKVTLKSVDQEPAAGTMLTSGSKVIVYFEDTDSMMVDIFEGGHSGLVGKTTKEIVEKAAENEAVDKIIAGYRDRKELTPEEETILTNFFKTDLQIDLVEGEPGKDFDSAYKVMIAAKEIMS